jgi:hypothetical protein
MNNILFAQTQILFGLHIQYSIGGWGMSRGLFIFYSVRGHIFKGGGSFKSEWL